jgi:hypothetical protein
MSEMKWSKNKALAKAKADRYFSEYIRERDSVGGVAVCCTCGKRVSEFDCGHFISRRMEATRYDEENAHAQCLGCNRFQHGRQYEHGLHVDRVHGEGTAGKVHIKSRMLCKRKQADYERIAEEFKKKIEDLKK